MRALLAAVTVILHLGQHGNMPMPSLVDGADSDSAVRYVCYDANEFIQAIITEQGHDARICSCPVGLTCMQADYGGSLGDKVVDGQIVTPGSTP